MDISQITTFPSEGSLLIIHVEYLSSFAVFSEIHGMMLLQSTDTHLNRSADGCRRKADIRFSEEQGIDISRYSKRVDLPARFAPLR
jgi:hypothetical protein